MKNNFTRPAEGLPALELACFYDTDLSRIAYDGPEKEYVQNWLRENLPTYPDYC